MMAGRSVLYNLTPKLRRICCNDLRVPPCLREQTKAATHHTPPRQMSVLAVLPPLQDSPLTPALCRSASTAVSVEQPGRIKRFIKKMGWLDHSKSRLKRSGYVLYESACRNVLREEFFRVCDLPDTFYSWFLVTELHVWMLMVRLMAEGEEGRFTRNAMVEALWEDSETRSKKLGAASLTIRQEQIQSIGSSFQAAIFAYDEGLMSEDHVLASALWRRLFSQECSDPERLECCVHYVRKQMAMLDSLSRQELLLDCKVHWIPLLEKDS